MRRRSISPSLWQMEKRRRCPNQSRSWRSAISAASLKPGKSSLKILKDGSEKGRLKSRPPPRQCPGVILITASSRSGLVQIRTSAFREAARSRTFRSSMSTQKQFRSIKVMNRGLIIQLKLSQRVDILPKSSILTGKNGCQEKYP